MFVGRRRQTSAFRARCVRISDSWRRPPLPLKYERRHGVAPLQHPFLERHIMAAPRVCIDRLLPRDLHRWTPTVHHEGTVRAIMVARKMWTNGSTLRVRFLGGSPAQRSKARQQALLWTQHANLTFEFGEAPEADIRIAFDPDDGAWSYIGTDCRAIPLDQPTMNLGFLDGGTAAHEFGHALGLAHEHQNPEGGI